MVFAVNLIRRLRCALACAMLCPCFAAEARAQALDLQRGFENPPAAAKPQVWWHWMNGNVTREGITADLEAMAEVGIGGALVFSLAGPHHHCDTPPGPARYLSPLWLDLMKHAADEAQRLGMEIGMHSCAGWATTGGPWVPPDLAMQRLVSSELVVDGGRRVRERLPRPAVVLECYRDVAVFAIRADQDTGHRLSKWQPKAGQAGCSNDFQPDLGSAKNGIAIHREAIIELTSALDARGELDWQAPEGRWKIVRIGHTPTGKTNMPAPPEATGLEIDKLRPEGLQLHWRKGIEPVLDHLGGAVGKSFRQVLIDSYEAGLHHWTPRMRDEFQQRRGYDPGPLLLALTGRVVGGTAETERFLWDFRRTIADLFAVHYYGQMAELCHSRGLLFAVEPYTSTFEGLQVGARADIPIGEFWATGGYSHTLRLASSIAHLRGLPIAAAEAFTAGPDIGKWLNHPGSLKESGDKAWGEGINRLVIHSYAHQPWLDVQPGMTMGEYGIHFGRTNTWWKPGKAWVDYMARSQFLLQAGEPIADVLHYAGDAAPNKAVIDEALTAAGYAYDSCGTEDLLALEVDEGCLVVPSGRRYRLLVLPKHGFYRPVFARKLEALVAAGAHVLGPRPARSPSLGDQPAADDEVRAIGHRVWGNPEASQARSSHGKGWVYTGLKTSEALQQMGVPPALGVSGSGENLSWMHRQHGQSHWFFVANRSKSRVAGDWGFRIPAGLIAENFDPESGKVHHLPSRMHDGRLLWLPMSLEPGKSTFVVFRRQAEGTMLGDRQAEGPADAEWVSSSATGLGLRVWSNGHYKITHNNGSAALAIDHLPKTKPLTAPWQVTFPGRGNQPDRKMETEVLFAWNGHRDPALRHFSGTATYRTQFSLSKADLDHSSERWLSLGAVSVIAEVAVNGQRLATLWHPPFRIELGTAAKEGTNQLEVRVTNLWINRLIGDAALPQEVEWDGNALKRWPDWLVNGDKRPDPSRTFTTWKHWQADDPLQPSGMTGPVQLEFSKTIPLQN